MENPGPWVDSAQALGRGQAGGGGGGSDNLQRSVVDRLNKKTRSPANTLALRAAQHAE